MITPEEALRKAQRYCAYQERCSQDVVTKLKSLGLPEKYHLKLLNKLKEENYLNEQRYVELFIQGKFNIKKWGRLKITRMLREKSIANKVIEKAISEINEKDYLNTLQSLTLLKINEFRKVEDIFQRRNKIAKSLITKGYEPDLVWSILKDTEGSTT